MTTSPFIILSINHLFNLCKINIVLFLQNVNCYFQNFRIGISKSRSRKRKFQFRKLTALQSLLFLFLLFVLFFISYTQQMYFRFPQSSFPSLPLSPYILPRFPDPHKSPCPYCIRSKGSYGSHPSSPAPAFPY